MSSSAIILGRVDGKAQFEPIAQVANRIREIADMSHSALCESEVGGWNRVLDILRGINAQAIEGVEQAGRRRGEEGREAEKRRAEEPGNPLFCKKAGFPDPSGKKFPQCGQDCRGGSRTAPTDTDAAIEALAALGVDLEGLFEQEFGEAAS